VGCHQHLARFSKLLQKTDPNARSLLGVVFEAIVPVWLLEPDRQHGVAGECQRFTTRKQADHAVTGGVASGAANHDPWCDLMLLIEPPELVVVLLREPIGAADRSAPGNPGGIAVWEKSGDSQNFTSAGRTRGIGNEFILAGDMRFASRQTALFGNPEVGVGLVPGGGAMEWLPRLVGRSRALEIVLSGDDFNADIAERYGWVNDTLDDEELDSFVDALMRRLASFDRETLAAAKSQINRFGIISSSTTSTFGI
jgi:Enoyl-CoA hydratase/isomerase